MPDEPMDFGAFFKGFCAYRLNLWRAVVCPYPQGELARAWMAGWQAAGR